METIHILGIHSSPIKEGNVAHLLNHALQEAQKEEGVATESISLAGMSISDCTHCNWCARKQTADQLCAIEDDAAAILKKIQACDILVLASPVYFARLSGLMACMIDRTRCFLFGRQKSMALRGKIGLALTVAWMRNAGIETTLESLHNAFLLHEMWTPPLHHAGVIFGVGAVSGQMNADLSYKSNKVGVMEDAQALKSARLLMQKGINMARNFKQEL